MYKCVVLLQLFVCFLFVALNERMVLFIYTFLVLFLVHFSVLFFIIDVIIFFLFFSNSRSLIYIID